MVLSHRKDQFIKVVSQHCGTNVFLKTSHDRKEVEKKKQNQKIQKHKEEVNRNDTEARTQKVPKQATLRQINVRNYSGSAGCFTALRPVSPKNLDTQMLFL